MLDLDNILNFLRTAGPTLPSKVAKNIQSDIMIASALLSDLVSQGKVKITQLKVGGSPIYYVQGQEEKLYDFAAGNVKPKDMLILERLKREKILRENDLDLLSKVGLRSLKDFAIPLHVTINGNKEVFWKWHLTQDAEMNQIIGLIINKDKSRVKEEVKPEFVEKVVEKKEKVEEKVEEKKEVVEEKIKEPAKHSPDHPPREEVISESKEEKFLEKKEVPPTILPSTAKEEPSVQPQKEPTVTPPAKPVEIKSQQQRLVDGDVKKREKNNGKKVKPKIRKKRKNSVPDKFMPVLKQLFAEMEITIKSYETVRKNSEMNLLVRVPSVVGELTYFCKAKSKSRCDEKDLSSAYMEAQIKKLPLLFIYGKEITKKTKEMLKSGAFQNVVMKNIG